jgi:transcriptional regulator with XRE-family HTH domain
MRQDLASETRRAGAPLSPAKLRARIAETNVRQGRVAARLDISEGQLSHILHGRKRVDDIALLARIAEAIEAVAAEAVA